MVWYSSQFKVSVTQCKQLNWTVRSEAELYLCHVVQFQVSVFQYGTNLGQERAGKVKGRVYESVLQQKMRTRPPQL